MKRGVIRSSCSDDRGAVGPLYAIALTTLIVVAGVGFDYGRMVTAQSELQNAADQAALAAATQLDGTDGAMDRARKAARNYFYNTTRTADDDKGPAITIADSGFTFFSDGNAGTPASSDADASAVEVSVDSREVFYALTPVVAVMSSGGILAHARAMMKRSACQVPPIMVCVDRNDFPLPADEGKGLLMHFLPSQTSTAPLAPGNLGFLSLEGGPSDNRMLGRNGPFNDCTQLENIETDPGNRSTQVEAMNSRFDVFANPLSCKSDSGDFCPSQNVRKNMVIKETGTIDLPAGWPTTTPLKPGDPGYPQCGAAGMSRASANQWLANPDAGAFPNDDCFAAGTCSYLGNGSWNIGAYLAANHPGVPASSFAKGTRYEVYKWELQDPAQRLQPRIVQYDSNPPKRQGTAWRQDVVNYCAYPQPVFATPLQPSLTQKDRRILPVAAVNCTGLRGRDRVKILRWIDVLLLDTSNQEIHAEVIGPALRPGNLTGFQYYARGKAVLIR